MNEIPQTLVVSQPMFLPWYGLFEQIRLADFYVHYDDVQLPQGRSFSSRVQLKTANGVIWLTTPIDRTNSGKNINDTVLLDKKNWCNKHLKIIRHDYAKAPHFDLMFDLVSEVYQQKTSNLSEFNIFAIERLAKFLGLSPIFKLSSEIGVRGSGTQRLVDICSHMQCNNYVTGHGAIRYLKHEEFEEHDISVSYMDYKKKPYRQMYGEFTPYVSIIDAIANCGNGARDLLCSESTYWRNFNGVT